MFVNKRFLHMIWLAALLAVLLVALPVAAQDGDAEATGEAPTPFEMPAPPEGMDPDAVVVTVNGDEITLEDFRTRVRYERLFFYTFLENAVREQATIDALNLDDPNNQFGPSIQQFLGQIEDTQLFGEQVLIQLVAEKSYIDEAMARDLEPDQCALDTEWSRAIFVELGEDCEATDEFVAAREAHIAQAEELSGITRETLDAIIYSRAVTPLVQEALAEGVELPDIEVVRSRHFRVASEEVAVEAIERLESGEDFFTVFAEYDPNAANAFGNDGVYSNFGRGEMVTEFETAAFENEVGDIVGPVQSQFGYHVIEVLDQSVGVSARQIVLETEEEANTALDLLRDEGVDFAELVQEYSIDQLTRSTGGDLGFIGPGTVELALYGAIQAAEPGDLVGPIEVDAGWAVVEVTDQGTEPTQASVRHILVDEEEVAQDLIDRLDGGEDFTALVRQFSTDPGAGPRGDTLATFTNGQQSGFYAADQQLEGLGSLAAASPEFVEAVFSAEAGEIVGPVQIGESFFVIVVEELDVRPPTPGEVDVATQAIITEWEDSIFDEEALEQNDIWRQYVPTVPVPSNISAALAVLDPYAAEAREFILEQRRAGSIINRLSTLQMPEPAPEATPEPEATAEPEATEEAEAEATEEASE